jgi:transketolase N-terminal domain/subunit
MAFIKKRGSSLGEGCFSFIEILVYLYEEFLKKNDKFILSKSHSSLNLQN